MLSLLCGSPDVVDSPFYDTQSRRSRSRRPSIRGVLSRSGSGSSSKSSKKKRVLKGSIGAPMDFRHESHVGADNMMAPTGAWDLDQWRTELEKYMQPQPVSVIVTARPIQVQEPPSPPPSSIVGPRRKPVPSLLPPSHDQNTPLSSVASTPTRSAPIDESVALV
ncbi:hypothetical protein FRC12_024041 [Ceratobasidium sp. 428]|nr:hypothetical protein FRC12_024041 [Ceratobasidium sp. 428]